jgi:ribonuclease HII
MTLVHTKPLPDFSFETEILNKGFKIIAGLDEVGRGSFAGPVVAAAVAFAPINNLQFTIVNKFSKKIVINDSKKLTAKQREVADIWIRKNCLACGVGSASVAQINRLGIKKATDVAFRKAISETNRLLVTDYCLQKTQKMNYSKQSTVSGKQRVIDFLLIDAFHIPRVKGLGRKHQKPIVKGDSLSISIAAASIIAKVYRDNLMVSLSKKYKYKKYEWDKNKGYGTKKHREAIVSYGVTKLHRRQFVQNILAGYHPEINSLQVTDYCLQKTQENSNQSTVSG